MTEETRAATRPPIDLRAIDLNLLHIFEAIYTTGNITRTAQRLGMNQPTVSNALARLRQQFGDPLFVRSERGVTPTPFADTMIHPVRQALEILRDGFAVGRSFDPSSVARTFHLALNDFTVVTLLPGLLAEIAATAPDIRVNVISHSQRPPVDALLKGEADLAVDTFHREVAGLRLVPIHLPAAVVVARRDHPAIRGAITREQYAAADHVALAQGEKMRIQTETMLLSQGISRRIVCEVSNCLQLVPLVLATDLIAVVPAPYARSMNRLGDLQILPLPFSPVAQRLHIATLQEKARDPGIEWINRHLLRAAAEAAAEEDWLPDDGPLRAVNEAR